MSVRSTSDSVVTTLILPAYHTVFDDSFFPQQPSLVTITFAPCSQLRRLESGALGRCSDLKSITFPASLEFLPGHLFVLGPYGLRRQMAVETVFVERGSRLREISEWAFSQCESLTSICLPASVEKICGATFIECGLKRIEIESGNKCYRVSGAFVVDFNEQRILRYFGDATEISIPDTLEVVGSHRFWKCKSVQQISFGSNSKLCSIEDEAFALCSALDSICIPSLATRLGKSSFFLCTSLR
jgi:hypothetical protein